MDDHAFRSLAARISSAMLDSDDCTVYEQMETLHQFCCSQGERELLAFYLQATYGADMAAIERDWDEIERAIRNTIEANKPRN